MASESREFQVPERGSWDDYFMGQAFDAASRSTCLRLKVGAVLVQDKRIRGTGYNGAPSNIDECITIGECLMRDGHCIRAVHAETNLVLETDAAERKGATVYVTDRPCWTCANNLANSGIKEVVYAKPYHRDAEMVEQLFKQAGIILRQYPADGVFADD